MIILLWIDGPAFSGLTTKITLVGLEGKEKLFFVKAEIEVSITVTVKVGLIKTGVCCDIVKKLQQSA